MEGERSSDEDDAGKFGGKGHRYEGYEYEDDFFEDEEGEYGEEGEYDEDEEDRLDDDFDSKGSKMTLEGKQDEEEEEEGEEEKEEDEERRSDEDWEREAKKKVRIDFVEPAHERRRTIFELDSYAATGPSASDILRLGRLLDDGPSERKKAEIRYSMSMGSTGIARINLSDLTQKIVGCVIGENVTTEYPWVWVKKEVIEDNLDLHSESSDFLPMKQEIEDYPEEKMLIGYAPSLTEEGQFYFVLSTEAKKVILEHIELQRREHESHVRSNVYKQPNHWTDLGSGQEVDDNVIKNRRPLLEVELVSTANLLDVPMNLVDRRACDQRDGYIELLPYRQTFENVSRTTISRSTQVTPYAKDNDAQTAPSMPVNSWFQYRYEYKPIDISAFTEDDIEDFTKFLHRYTNSMCDQVQVNATWDIYADDYKQLVRNEKDTMAPVPIRYKEHQSFYDGRYVKQKVIGDLAWHPLWTGIAYAAYTNHAKSETFVGRKAYNEVVKDSEGDNVVLIWSFNDCLSPKLILESPREVTSISVCPSDGNVIIGGCANGQMVIWNIPGKIERVEAVEVNTSSQVKYRIAMRTLMKWMRESIGTTVVRPVAISSLHQSQKGAITQIVWLPCYHKVEKNGKIQSLPAGTKFEDLPWQFVTSSTDGTIAFWDLKVNSTLDNVSYDPSCQLITTGENYTDRLPGAKDDIRKKNAAQVDKKSRPSALVESISPYKAFDRVWKPFYLLLVQYPADTRRPMLSSITMHSPRLEKVVDEAFSGIKTDITIRRYYKLVLGKPDYIMQPEIFVGTVEGLVGVVTWNGFDTDSPTGREECQWKWMKHVHDGPITHIVRSKYHRKITATIGGHIFAVWREDYGEPIIWKKSSLSYTGCAWGTFRPTILILVRSDGTAEIWDFIVKSKEATITQSVSGRIITGLYTHQLPLDPQCVGFCDYNGTLRMFTTPPKMLAFDVADIAWMGEFIDYQVNRIKEFKEWQDTWNETNFEIIDKKRKLAEREAEVKRAEAETKLRDEMAEMLKQAEEQAKGGKKSRKPWQFIEEAKERWHEMEMKRMQITILEKKGLRREVLDRQRAPVLKIRQEARDRKKKIREILQRQDKIFEETVTFLFPEQIERKHTSLPSITAKPVDEEEEEDAEETSEKAEELPIRALKGDAEIMEDFLEIQEQALEKMRHQVFQHEFDWRIVLKEGEFRRNSIEEALQRNGKVVE